MLDAMAAAPRLTKLKLGPVRDEAQRRRHQLLTMEAVERARRERRVAEAAGRVTERRERRDARRQDDEAAALVEREGEAAPRGVTWREEEEDLGPRPGSAAAGGLRWPPRPRLLLSIRI